MAVAIERQPGLLRVIPGAANIYEAGELRDALCAVLAEADPGIEVEVDMSAVEGLDTAGLQLLVAAKRAALAQGRPLRLARHSPATLAVIDLYGMAAFFGDPLVMGEREQ